MVSWGHSGSQKDSSTFSSRSICPGILQPHLQLRSEEKHLLILSFIFQFVCLLYEQELRVSILHSYLCRLLLLLQHPGILAMHHTWLLWLQRHNKAQSIKNTYTCISRQLKLAGQVDWWNLADLECLPYVVTDQHSLRRWGVDIVVMLERSYQ